MGNVGKDERNPGEEEIPDQAEVPVRIAVCHSCQNECDAHRAGNIEQYKDREAMPVAKNEIMKSVSHERIESFQGGSMILDQIPDQVNVAGGAPAAGEDGGGFGLVLRAVVDEVCHRLPQDSFVRLTLC